MSLFCEPRRKLYGSAKLAKSLHEATADGPSGSIWADHETKNRNYHNRTIHGSMSEAQAYPTKKLRERDLGRDLEAKIKLNEYLDGVRTPREGVALDEIVNRAN